MKLTDIRLDPFPRLTEFVGKSFSNPRIILLSVIISKVCIDRIYTFAKFVNPNAALDTAGNETLDILEYHHPRSAADVYQFISGYGHKGRMAYSSLLMYDCGFLLARTIPMCLLCYWAFSRAPQWTRLGVWIPLATSIVDLFENFLIWILLNLYPRQIDLLGQLAAWAILAKWTMLWITVAVLAIGLLLGIYYGFHGLLADSVLMDKDRKDREMARRHLNDAVKRNGQRASASSGSASTSQKKKQ
ncbi:uncharacterized protein BYT42DRAFT_535095 [Radiomyces spectabilis]|uniref:uncharacterized protein n=1 Tax=Radiomyces spectabilis TaxID=64574 RepID=UPI0022210967|nr:uncharacterized protein BYT42DRAFT_535095 [Radiomyces spectabilis]KAI8374133.1 hypothetical protein BYT42DRAFT_535095 [Radiomyces spectabilis]